MLFDNSGMLSFISILFAMILDLEVTRVGDGFVMDSSLGSGTMISGGLRSCVFSIIDHGSRVDFYVMSSIDFEVIFELNYFT